MTEYHFDLTEVIYVHAADFPNEPELGAFVIVTDIDFTNHMMFFETLREAIEEGAKISFAIEQAISQSN